MAQESRDSNGNKDDLTDLVSVLRVCASAYSIHLPKNNQILQGLDSQGREAEQRDVE